MNIVDLTEAPGRLVIRSRALDAELVDVRFEPQPAGGTGLGTVTGRVVRGSELFRVGESLREIDLRGCRLRIGNVPLSCYLLGRFDDEDDAEDELTPTSGTCGAAGMAARAM